jgi:putative ABC transport system permease protein
MREDIRDSLRSLRGAPLYTAVALTVLALAIGSTTAIFSVVDAVVLRGLPFDEHDRLVAVSEVLVTRTPTRFSNAAPPNYVDWRAQQQVFESMAAVRTSQVVLREPGTEPEELRGQRISPDFFTVLRVQPAHGRAFQPGDALDGRHRVAIISDGLWRRRYGADPDVIGRTIPLDTGSYDVVGIMPPGFAYPAGAARPAEIWMPLVIPPQDLVRNPGRRAYYLSVVARLKDGVTLEQASAQMDQIAAALAQAYAWNEGWRIGVRPLHALVVGEQTRSWMWMLLGAVGMVLLIACTNVANLMLARATARAREVGIRAALGAGRARLMRQLIVESLVLSSAGTVLGVALAWWGVQALCAAMPEGVPRVASIALDLRVLGVAACLSIGTGLAFGLVPALQLSRPDLVHALKDGARGATAGRGRQRLRGALVIVEVALAMVLLVGAGLFIGSFASLTRMEPGFVMRGLLTSTIRLSAPTADESRGAQLLAGLAARLEQIQEVESAAAVSGGLPLSGTRFVENIALPGRPVPDDDGVSLRAVTPRYHTTMRIPLRGGRYLSDADTKSTEGVMLINEAAAKKYFDGEPALGRTAVVQGERRIVGVVGDIRQEGPESDMLPEVYIPLAQLTFPTFSGEIVVRTSGNPYRVLPAVKAAVYGLAPDVPMRNVMSMEDLLAQRIAPRRFNMILLSLFGVLGLVISAVGIYGVMAFIVGQRTHEIGVRMALGATRRSVMAMVLRKASTLIAAGLAAGALGAWFLGEGVQRFLFRVEPTDPRVFTGALMVLALTALLASVVPARRAANVDPLRAFRQD